MPQSSLHYISIDVPVLCPFLLAVVKVLRASPLLGFGCQGSGPAPHQHSRGQPHLSGDTGGSQAACRVAVAAAPAMGPLFLIRARGWDLLAPSWQGQPGGCRVWADPITAFVQPHCHRQPLQGSQTPDSCVTIACEICFVMLFLHYYTTD